MPNTPNPTDELRALAVLFANRIGSPWGEGATYSNSPGAVEPGDEDDLQDNGRLYSHLDEKDFELFVHDFTEAVNSHIQTVLEEIFSTPKGHIPDESCCEECDTRIALKAKASEYLNGEQQ